MPSGSYLPVHATLGAALSAADDERVDAWLQRFFRNEGKNVPLADGLRLQPRFYLGPVDYPLDRLVRCCGPEPGIAYLDPEPSWGRRIGTMAAAIGEGWEPPPFLVYGETYALMDGNHRAEALLRAGRVHHPAIFVFDSTEEREGFVHRDDHECPLLGGHSTSEVVRIGGTVRRPTAEAGAFAAKLLRFLEDEGFDGAPRHLGYDGRGRATVSYIDGYILERHLQYAPAQASSAAALLRKLHDATAGSALAAGAEVVCHGDAKPRNTVFTGYHGDAVAFIDFDNARPGDRLDDIAYLGWTFALTSYRNDVWPIEHQVESLIAVAEGHGLTSEQREGVVQRIMEMQRRSIRGAASRSGEHAAGQLEWSRRELDWTERHAQLLEDALS